MSTARTVPVRNDKLYTIHTCTTWVKTITQRVAARTAKATWVATCRRRLSKRSATTPPHAPHSRMGRNCRPVSIPSATPLCVSWRTSSGAATDCIHVPVAERSGNVPKPPASDPAIAPAVFHA